MKRFQVVVLLVVIALITTGAQAAFIVEGNPGGLAQDTNFAGFGKPSINGGAIGLTTASIWTGTGAVSAGGTRNFTFYYIPGTNADNVTIAAGTDLGNGDLASGMVGGGTGLYNVYATWPASTNVNIVIPGDLGSYLGADITVTSDGADVVSNHNQNTGYGGGNDKWQLVAENVSLTAGTLYSVDMYAVGWTWTSMRANGVMWEAVPEPASMVLLGLGGLLLRSRRRR